ncbi:MAG TPA: hypothetical protein VFQ91_10175 [Bryobacteraceae bacterium]|nr:hypothetical protein [Bryobacteraceae bacterium]
MRMRRTTVSPGAGVSGETAEKGKFDGVQGGVLEGEAVAVFQPDFEIVADYKGKMSCVSLMPRSRS